MKRKGRKYTLEEILPHVHAPAPYEWKRGVKVDRTGWYLTLDGDEVKVISPRLQVFKRSLTCVRCGLAGTFFVKEIGSKRDGRYHLNLYGVDGDGEEVLMTKDHIHPQAKGGSDNMDNLQTMCLPCNTRKADTVD